jgi:hypothetical protein
MGRLYKTVKQNPILNLKQFQTDNGDRGENFSPRSGPHATAEAIAAQIGVSYRTVQNAAKFTDVVEALQEISPQAAEREFRDLDEVLIWVDRNQLGRRNLIDSQRTEVIGRLYNTLKQNPVLNLKQFQSGENGEGTEDRAVKLTALKGKDATAQKVAKATGVSVRTVRRAGKFAEAVAALERISPKAAEIVRRDEWLTVKTPPLFRGRAGGRERYVMEALKLQSGYLHHRLQNELPKP